jgi:hypothetical protein
MKVKGMGMKKENTDNMLRTKNVELQEMKRNMKWKK